jgi:hypothetical protein
VTGSSMLAFLASSLANVVRPWSAFVSYVIGNAGATFSSQITQPLFPYHHI